MMGMNPPETGGVQERDGVDTNALAEALWLAYWDGVPPPWIRWRDVWGDWTAAAVAAADNYVRQRRAAGWVEVRRDDLDRTIDWYALKVPPYTQEDRDTYDRICAALAPTDPAPVDGGEEGG